MVVQPPPKKDQATSEALAKVWPNQDLQQPPRTPWGRLTLLIIGFSLIIAAGVVAGWGVLVQRYPQSPIARWWPSSTTRTVVREVSTNAFQTVPTAARSTIEHLFGLANNQGQGGIYTQNEILASAVPLSSNGWFVVWAEAIPSETELVVVPGIGQPAAVEEVLRDPATPFAFIRTSAENTSSTNFSKRLANLNGQPVWVVSPGPNPALAVTQILHEQRPTWELSDKLEFSYRVAQPLQQQVGSVAVSTSGDVIGLTDTNGNIWPLNVVEPLLASLLQQGVIERPALGVYTLDRDLAVIEADPTATGLLVGNVGEAAALLPGGPAELAGLTAGTIVYEINGKTAHQPLFYALLEFKPTDTIELTIDRDGVRQTVSALLGSVQP